MTHLLTSITLLFVLPLCTADTIMQLDGENAVFRILLNRIVDLEENVRKSDRKLEEITVLKRRLDDAERRLSLMQDLQYRLEKSEEKLFMLENRDERKNCDQCQESLSSSTVSFSELNVRKEDTAVDSVSGNASTTMFSQAEKSNNVEKLVSFKNRIQGGITPIMTEEKTERRSIPRKVAFTAMFSSAPITLMAGRSFLFDRVDYNERNAYDKASGAVTCPVTGTYFFYTNILTESDAMIVSTEIMHEGNGKGRTFAFGREQGGISATLHCRTGERVWVRTRYGSEIYGGDHSSFSGFLLWEDANESISN